MFVSPASTSLFATSWTDPASGRSLVYTPFGVMSAPTTFEREPISDVIAGAVVDSGASLVDAIRSALSVAPGAGAIGTLPARSEAIGQPPAPQDVAPPRAPLTPPAHPVAAIPAPVVAAPAVERSASPVPVVTSTARALAGFASATGSAIAKVAGTGAAGAKRVGSELWAGVRSPRAVHVTQVQSKYNTRPAAGNKDCGPASVVMALGLLDVKIPGVHARMTPQQRINHVRRLAGNEINTDATSNHDLARALEAAGAQTSELTDAAAIRSAVLAGKPVILNGNPRHPGAYGFRFSASQMLPFDGAHWIVVSGYDTATKQFIINDPLSRIGAVKVSARQLEAYRGGSLGIEVSH
jgi:hypothetical protein